MKTDPLLYELFQNFPALFFELIGQDPALARGYDFDSIEVKQIAFRIDAVFKPQNPDQPLYFLECQFQKDKAIYHRLIAQIAIYFRRKRFDGAWQAAILFARRSMDPGFPLSYQEFQASGKVQVFYLEDHQGDQGSIAFQVLALLTIPKRSLKSKVGDLLPRLKTESLPSERKAQIMEMLETILVSKFPNLTRREIETMLKIDSLRNTRVFQEGVEEGVEKGRQEGRQEGELRGEIRGQREMLLQFMTLKFGSLSAQVVSQIQAINSTEKLQQLADAIIHSPDLQTFLQNL
jgi:predicted transposase/invertase (TIGR01784 family)